MSPPCPYIFKSPLEQKRCLPEKENRQCQWSKDVSKNGPTAHTTWEWKPRSTKAIPDIVAAIGNTPMVRLNKIPQSEGVECEIYAKCEFMNPLGSVKDRMVIRLIEDAEKSGVLKPGGTVIEVSSGNTGGGLAWICAIKGYKFIVTMPDKISKEKEAIIRAFGGDVVRASQSVPGDAPNGMFGTAHELHKKIPNSIIIDQFANPSNPLTHYDTTAYEIYDQLDGQVDMVVLGCGTGGTMTGVSRKFREISPKTMFIGADPYGSTYAEPPSINETDVKFVEVEGIGYDIKPAVCDRSLITKWYKFHDKDTFNMARRLIKEEGLPVGGTSGLLLCAAIKAAKEFKLGKGKKVVILLPDSMKNYLTKYVQDQWMETRGFIPCVNEKKHWWWDIKVTDLEHKPLNTINPNVTLQEALQIMDKTGVEYLPVVEKAGNTVGVAIRKYILNKLISGDRKPSDIMYDTMDRLFPKIPSTSNLGLVARTLELENYVTILDKDEKPLSILTVEDVWANINKKKA